MEVSKLTKEAFTVIGMEGSTLDGEGFIQKLWQEANSRFGEISAFVKRDRNGNPAGIWGTMSDLSRSFMPWEDGFSRGLYLAGAECHDGSEPPAGWTKWVIPSFEYLYTEAAGDDTFGKMLVYLGEHGFSLAGAVQEFTCLEENKSYLLFPIRKP